MHENQREFTFLVRIRRQDEVADSQWRGSVHEVSSGKRRFVSGARDVIDFITSYLHAERDAPP